MCVLPLYNFDISTSKLHRILGTWIWRTCRLAWCACCNNCILEGSM